MREISRRDVMAAGAGMVPFFGLAGFALAQRDDRSGRTTESSMGHDPVLAAKLLIKGRRQIEACRFAMDKLQHDECKAFAKAEIDEHEHIKQQLSQQGYEFPTSGNNRSGVVTTGATDGDDRQRGMAVTVGKISLSPEASGMIAMGLEVLEQCLTTYKAEMGKLQGMKLDKCFIGDQLHAHYEIFDHAMVFRKHSTRNLATVLDEGKPVIERHIATCKQIMDKLESSRGYLPAAG